MTDCDLEDRLREAEARTREAEALMQQVRRRAEYIPKIISLLRILSDMKMKYSS